MGTVNVAKMSEVVANCSCYVLNQLDTVGYKLFRDPQALGSSLAMLGSLQPRAFVSYIPRSRCLTIIRDV